MLIISRSLLENAPLRAFSWFSTASASIKSNGVVLNNGGVSPHRCFEHQCHGPFCVTLTMDDCLSLKRPPDMPNQRVPFLSSRAA